MECSACHKSTEAWQAVELDAHPVELVGEHAGAQWLQGRMTQDMNRGTDPVGPFSLNLSNTNPTTIRCLFWQIILCSRAH